MFILFNHGFGNVSFNFEFGRIFANVKIINEMANFCDVSSGSKHFAKVSGAIYRAEIGKI